MSKSPGIQNGGPMYCMDPHDHRCCQHNVGHAWPYYVQHLWMATAGNGLAAVLYAPCHVTAKVGDGAEVTITEETRYPFEETVRLRIATPRPVSFPLLLRIPAWCEKARLTLNGERVSLEAKSGGYVRLERTWNSGDTLGLELPMQVRMRTWTRNRNTVSVDRGPLTYSLRIREKYVRHGGTDRWPAFDIFPDSPWNYGLTLGAGDATGAFEVVPQPWPADDQPFRWDAAPIQLKARGQRIPPWTLDEQGLVREVQNSPVKSAEPVEELVLIPMGAARLRIASFPVIGSGPDAVEWVAAPKVMVRASHCHEGDDVMAVCDGAVPRSSNDQSIPRFTWWDRRGTTEWIERDLDQARSVSEVEAYWFDDTGVGSCRVPASWRLLARREGRWVPVEGATGFGVAKDQFNRVTFPAIVTDGLRIEAALRPGFSGGLLEWRVR